MDVTVYTTNHCSFCVMLKDWLTQIDVPFTEINVEEDQEAAERMVAMSGQMAVPFTTVQGEDGQVNGVLGFDRPTLAALFKQYEK